MQGAEPAPKVKARKVVISETRAKEYFPDSYTTEQMESVIFELLEKWKSEQ